MQSTSYMGFRGDICVTRYVLIKHLNSKNMIAGKCAWERFKAKYAKYHGNWCKNSELFRNG